MIWNKDQANRNSSIALSNNVMASGNDQEDIWVELESDPGLFTLLIEDFGVRGVQVDEIYDLNSPASLQDSPIYGFIFLFKWVEGSRRARGTTIVNSTGTIVTDDDIVKRIFFAQQIVTNACATHALLSILLNCDEHIELGEMLTQFKNQTYGMTPEDKGNAVGQSGPLAWAHNKHARPDARRQTERDASSMDTGRGKSVKRYRMKTVETFHFISYVPINGRLYELDGLKSYPIDHGEIPPGTMWTEHFQNVISQRIGIAQESTGTEIRYNLMALVPSKKDHYQKKLDMLQMNRGILYNILEELIQATHPNLIDVVRRNAKSMPGSDENENSLVSDNLLQEDGNLINGTHFTQQLTVETNSGGETATDLGISSGVSDQSALNWPISTCEVVKIIKDSKTPNSEAGPSGITETEIGRTPSSTSPLSSLSEKDDIDRLASEDAEQDKASEKMEVEEIGRSSAVPVGVVGAIGNLRGMTLLDTKKVQDSKDFGSRVVKLATTRSMKFGYFGPLELVKYIKRLEEKIGLVERLLKDEIANHEQWELEDERRTNYKDEFIKTFISLFAEEMDLQPVEVSPKNGKAKGKRTDRTGSTAGRKKRCP